MSPLLLDCTLRDGGYYNNWDFSPDLISAYLQAMSSISADYVELGFRYLNRNGFKGGCAFTTDNFIRQFEIPANLKIGVMVNAGEIVNHPDGVINVLSKLFCPATQSPVTLVRIACHEHELKKVLPGNVWLKEQGYEVGINVMQIADRSEDEIERLATLVSQYPVDVLYFADSMGSMDPMQTSNIITALRRGWNGPLGIHTHDNMGYALANSLKAVEDGVTWIDGTVTGMGRGPGNVKTEYLAIELGKISDDPSRMTPLQSIIDNFFLPCQIECGWGTNTYYYLAGKYGIHPSYIQEMLNDSRYSQEDVLAVIEHLRKAGGKKFSLGSLESGREFYGDVAHGSWEPSSLIGNKEVLILGTGPGVEKHRQALEEFIRVVQPLVIALNTQTAVSADLINIRAACHPARLLADCAEHTLLPQPLVAPAFMLPESVRTALDGKEVLDFGLAVQPGVFQFNDNHCVLPVSLVIAYALAIATSGGASRILLAGFDGYAADDPRNAEMKNLLDSYMQCENAKPLLAITPTRYQVEKGSVYQLDAWT